MFRANDNDIGFLILNGRGLRSKIFEFSNFDDGILEQVGTVCHLQSNSTL